jgi:hypothetical protein
MSLSKVGISTLWSIIVLSAWSACGDEEPSKSEPTPGEEAGVDANASPQADAARDAPPSFDANATIPPADQLPELPPDDPDSGALAGSRVFNKQNPLIYLNDYPDAVYSDAYIYALAAGADVRLVGVISSAVDCKCSAGDNVDSSPRRQEWIDAARDAGFQNLPDNTKGPFGDPLIEPASGMVADTVRAASAATELIVAQAKLASRQLPLLIVSGGPITPLADAFLQDPSITKTTVVAWLAGEVINGELSLTTNYAPVDPWAAEIVLRHFRVFVFPTNLDSPAIDACRLASEVPPSALRDLLAHAGHFYPGHDADAPPALTINFPAYLKEYARAAMATSDLGTISHPGGNIWFMRAGDAVAGGDEFFRELRKAYKVAPDAGSFSDAGCAP